MTPDLFYNTTNETGPTLIQYRKKAGAQDNKVMELMKALGSASPSQLLPSFKNTPITSIRRALTNLTNEGKLVKTGAKMKGMFGRDEHIWKLP